MFARGYKLQRVFQVGCPLAGQFWPDTGSAATLLMTCFTALQVQGGARCRQARIKFLRCCDPGRGAVMFTELLDIFAGQASGYFAHVRFRLRSVAAPVSAFHTGATPD